MNNKTVRRKLRTFDILVWIIVLGVFSLTYVFKDGTGIFLFFAACVAFVMFLPVRNDYERELRKKYKYRN